jgi:hypothetical protein
MITRYIREKDYKIILSLQLINNVLKFFILIYIVCVLAK